MDTPCAVRLAWTHASVAAMKLDKRVILVTGGGSGIGASTVQRLREEGAVTVSLDLNIDRANASEPALGLACDVTDEVSVVAALDEVVARFGSVYGAVLNAGIALEVPLHETTLQQWNSVLAVNLTGAFLVAKHTITRMTGPGALVFHASMSGLVATADEPAYCASKAGVIGLSRAIAVDYASRGIRSNAVCPGVVDTPMTREQFAPHPTFRTLVEGMHPLGRFARPTEIAAATAYLISDDASFVTGTELIVDGGYTAK
jgi:NAD(P)-dependent dehydrogenase (short-subunit alcohol dehydrogenase family)